MALKYSLNVEYPVFDAAFINDNLFAVVGGGGEGKNGIMNKISLLKVVQGWMKEVSALQLDNNEDNPMSVAVTKDMVYAGVNESMAKRKHHKNRHLRCYSLTEKSTDNEKYEALHQIAAEQIFECKSTDEYQKVTRVSRDGSSIAIISSCDVLYLLNNRFSVELELSSTEELVDCDFSPDGKKLAYCTPKAIIVFEIGKSSKTKEIKIEAPKNSGSFAKLRFTGENQIIAGLNLPTRTGICLAKIDVNKGKITTSKMIRNLKAMTAMDAGEKYIAIASPDCTVAIFGTSSFDLQHLMKKEHEFAITCLAFNRRQNLLASGSIAYTVNVIDIPAKSEWGVRTATFVWSILSVIVILLLAVVLQFVINRQLLDALIPDRLSGGFSLGDLGGVKDAYYSYADSTSIPTVATSSESALESEVLLSDTVAELITEPEADYSKDETFKEDTTELISSTSTAQKFSYTTTLSPEEETAPNDDDIISHDVSTTVTQSATSEAALSSGEVESVALDEGIAEFQAPDEEPDQEIDIELEDTTDEVSNVEIPQPSAIEISEEGLAYHQEKLHEEAETEGNEENSTPGDHIITENDLEADIGEQEPESTEFTQTNEFSFESESVGDGDAE